MPNGRDPRFLKPAFILAPPKLMPRLSQLTDAKFIAQAATGGGAGSADIIAYISSSRARPAGARRRVCVFADLLREPAVRQQTAARLRTRTSALREAIRPTTLFARKCRRRSSVVLLFVQREPFKVNYYTGDGGGTGMDAVLQRAKIVEYQVDGRMSCAIRTSVYNIQVPGCLKTEA
jgi:hypothetical protein